MNLLLWQLAACVLERIRHMDHCRLRSRNSASTRKETMLGVIRPIVGFQVYVVGLKAVYCLGGLRFISQREYICIYIYRYIYIYVYIYIVRYFHLSSSIFIHAMVIRLVRIIEMIVLEVILE